MSNVYFLSTNNADRKLTTTASLVSERLLNHACSSKKKNIHKHNSDVKQGVEV